MSEITELHEPLMRWLKDQGILYRRSRSDRATSEMCGEPDFSFYSRNKALFLELKMPKTGKLSKEQVFRHAEYARAGCDVHVIRDLATAMELITFWLATVNDVPAATIGKLVTIYGQQWRETPLGMVKVKNA